jgi:hypothetical protein
MPVYREVYLEKDEPVPVQPNIEDLLRAETDDAEEALSWRTSTTSSRSYRRIRINQDGRAQGRPFVFPTADCRTSKVTWGYIDRDVR